MCAFCVSSLRVFLNYYKYRRLHMSVMLFWPLLKGGPGNGKDFHLSVTFSSSNQNSTPFS